MTIVTIFHTYYTHVTNITNDLVDLLLPIYLVIAVAAGIIYYKFPPSKRSPTTVNYKYSKNTDWRMQLSGKWVQIERTNMAEVRNFRYFEWDNCAIYVKIPCFSLI